MFLRRRMQTCAAFDALKQDRMFFFSILLETGIRANLKDSLFLKLCKSSCIGAHNFIVYRPARMRGPTFSGFQYLILNSSV